MIPRLKSLVLIIAAILAVLWLGMFMSPPETLGQKASKSTTGKRTPLKTTAAVYSCPMHPEVKGKRPGRCPKCGMNLRLTKPPEPTTASAPEVEATKPAGSRLHIPDVELFDQDGRQIHFYSDLVRGRTVAINFIFTTCTTVCPPLGATFARVQKDLGERAGRDVSFISISVDPVTDTPERLKAWAAKFHAGPPWTFVTGDKQTVNELLRALGASTASPQDHSPTVLIINDRLGQWTRTYGLAPPSRLVTLINDAMDGKLDNQEAAMQ